MATLLVFLCVLPIAVKDCARHRSSVPFVAQAVRYQGERKTRSHEKPTALLQGHLDVVQDSSNESSASEYEQIFCSSKLPYFQNRLCIGLQHHTKGFRDSIDMFRNDSNHSAFISAHGGNDMVSGAMRTIPDLLIDLAWMGCKTCMESMRHCKTHDTCQLDPQSRSKYPWRSIVVTSAKSYVTSQCWGIGSLLVEPALYAAFGPYLAGVQWILPWLFGQVADTYIAQYCIYLSDHLKGETVDSYTFPYDSTCVDHLWTIKLPGLFGILPSIDHTKDASSIMCWPTSGALDQGVSDEFLFAPSYQTSSSESLVTVPSFDIDISTILQTDKVCRDGPSALKCGACLSLAQAMAWRIREIYEQAMTPALDAQVSSDESIAEALQVIGGRMILHPNGDAQCIGDSDQDCLTDYSLCFLNGDTSNATRCTAKSLSNPKDRHVLCSALCETPCTPTNVWMTHPYCLTSASAAGVTCVYHDQGYEKLTKPTQRRTSEDYWVFCDPLSAKHYSLWQHRMATLYEKESYLRVQGIETKSSPSERALIAREILQVLSEAAPSARNIHMSDVALLRIAQLFGRNEGIVGAKRDFCSEAACCDTSTLPTSYAKWY